MSFTWKILSSYMQFSIPCMYVCVYLRVCCVDPHACPEMYVWNPLAKDVFLSCSSDWGFG